VTSNFTVLALGQVVARGLAFCVVLYLTRTLGADGYGTIAFALGTLGFATMVVDLGFDALGPLEVARGRTPVRRLAGAVILIRLALASVALPCLFVFAQLGPMTSTVRWVVFLYGTSLVANALDLSWALLGSDRMWPVAAGGALQQGLHALGILVAVRDAGGLVLVPVVFTLSRLACVLWLGAVFVRRHGLPQLGSDTRDLRRLAAASLPLSGSGVVGLLLQSVDVVMLGLFVGMGMAGLYGAAQRVAWLPALILGAHLTARRPGLARAALQGPLKVDHSLRRSMGLAIPLGVGVTAGGVALAAPLLVWLFGPDFAKAERALQLLLVGFSFQVVSRHIRLAVVSAGHYATDLRIMGLAAALNVALNLLLIPAFGMSGAAAATLASEGLILGLALGEYRALTGRLIPGVPLATTMACVGGMLIALQLMSDLALPLRVLVGGGVHGGLLLGSIRLGRRRAWGTGT